MPGSPLIFRNKQKVSGKRDHQARQERRSATYSSSQRRLSGPSSGNSSASTLCSSRVCGGMAVQRMRGCGGSARKDEHPVQTNIVIPAKAGTQRLQVRKERFSGATYISTPAGAGFPLARE